MRLHEFSAQEPLEIWLREQIGLDLESLGTSAVQRVLDELHRDEWASKDFSSLKERILARLLVPETWFFRDPGAFVLLQDHIRRWEFHPATPIRLLSVPCSTGEEPYSMALSLMATGLKPDRFEILAVDICSEFITRAQSAVFSSNSFREWKPDSHFRKEGSTWRLNQDVRNTLRFELGNLCGPDFLLKEEPFHIIFCKNVLIYLTAEARTKALTHLKRLLAPGGLLFTGHAEISLLTQEGWDTVPIPRAFACQRKSEPATQALAQTPYACEKTVSQGSQEPKHPPLARRVPKAAPQSPQLRRVAAIHPLGITSNEPVISCLQQAQKAADRGFLTQAMDLCQKHLDSAPGDPAGHHLMGSLLMALDRVSEAEESFHRVLYLDPAHYDALCSLSVLLERGGHPTQAQHMRRRAERAFRNQASKSGEDRSARRV